MNADRLTIRPINIYAGMRLDALADEKAENAM